MFLQVSHLSKTINGNDVLQDVGFSYEAFRRVAVAGETGSGKTTLLKAIAGLVQPDAGAIFFEGERVLGPTEKLLPGHSRIAYLSQHFELRNNYRVYDFLEMASKVGEKEAAKIYRLCQVDHLLKRRTDQLSGGERQRTALARLLTTSPRLLVLDEPYSNLDSLHKQVLKQVVNAIVDDGKTSCLMVSHDPHDVLPWAEEVLVMKDGRIVQKATPEQVYRQPESEYTGGLFGEYNLFSSEQASAIFAWQKSTGKKIFIRPENIRLEKELQDRKQGVVTAVSFFGSYYDVEVSFDGIKFWVKTSRAFFQKGDCVLATVADEDVWHV